MTLQVSLAENNRDPFSPSPVKPSIRYPDCVVSQQFTVCVRMVADPFNSSSSLVPSNLASCTMLRR